MVTGPSGSGKSSLVFDTLYAEGQRRYVETFSPVRAPVPRPHGQAAGRFHRGHPAGHRHRPDQPGAHLALDGRHDDRDQRPPEAAVRARRARSPAAAARGRCGATPRSRSTREMARARARPRAIRASSITFPVDVPKNFTEDEVTKLLAGAGLHAHPHARRRRAWTWCRTACRMASRGEGARGRGDRGRAAAGRGQGECVRGIDPGHRRQPAPECGPVPGATERRGSFSTDLHCADCDIHYSDPTPARFSFNSPIGACDDLPRLRARDRRRLRPGDSRRDRSRSRGGAVKIFQSKSFDECQDDLAKFAKKRGVALDIAWRDLPEAHRALGARRRRRAG